MSARATLGTVPFLGDKRQRAGTSGRAEPVNLWYWRPKDSIGRDLQTPVSPGSEQVAEANPFAAELLKHGFCPPTSEGTLSLRQAIARRQFNAKMQYNPKVSFDFTTTYFEGQHQ